ncbi:RNA polymerase sigma-70 factor [Moorena bouillonii]|uniref:RNA polymerase sigma-70 factor n=1 Tax=Moorena bouillonii PNG TaxID=568701 RepID=A0A1U7N3J8_9CYAN|nr:RNA polymerase sigma-70 factor [Moorena bouillonii]OLT60494.1 hypothetical protein BJP37_17230 [Moorena bouillonii PNG]
MKEGIHHDEQELTIALKEGDTHSFRIIHRLYRKKMLYYSYSILKSREDAEEIVQDAFLKLWENKQKLDEGKTFSGYLFIIVQNLTIKKLKKNAKDHFLKDIPENLISKYQADNDMNYKDLLAIFKEALEKLPEKKRTVFQLKREEGLTNKEVADQINVSVKTVEKHMTQALKFIEEYLRKHKKFILVITLFF